MTDTDGCSRYSSVERTEHLRHGRKLEYFTIGWNMVEAGVAIGAGWFAGSIALVGFGVDSLIESLSGSVLLWRLSSPAHDESREKISLKLVGMSFLHDPFLLVSCLCNLRQEEEEKSSRRSKSS